MDDVLDLTELREAVRSALKDRDLAIPGEEGRPFDRALWNDMAALGWLGLGVDSAHGGLGQGFAQRGVLHHELGRIVDSTPALTTLIAADVIGAHGADALKAECLPAIASGELSASLALPSGARIDLSGGGINGVADAVLFAADVDLLLVPVASGFAAVRRSSAGVEIEETPIVDLTRRMGRVTLRNVRVEKDALISLTPSDWTALENQIAVAIACDSIGGAHAIFERTIDYLGIREQFGRPIGSFQALKHRAAHWKVQLEAATALVRHAANALDTEEDASALASGAKFYAADLYASISEDCIQLHGGIGFTWEHACHLFLKRAKLNQQLFGGSTAHKERIARLAFNREPLISNPGGA